MVVTESSHCCQTLLLSSQHLFQVFLKSGAHPLGELVDYVIRIEFQARGSPHAHTILWIKDAPKLNINTDEEVCTFTDQYVKCNIPDDEELAQLVCRRHGKCCFHYPWPPSLEAVANFPALHCCSISKKEAEQLVKGITAVRKVLDNKDTPA